MDEQSFKDAYRIVLKEMGARQVLIGALGALVSLSPIMAANFDAMFPEDEDQLEALNSMADELLAALAESSE